APRSSGCRHRRAGRAAAPSGLRATAPIYQSAPRNAPRRRRGAGPRAGERVDFPSRRRLPPGGRVSAAELARTPGSDFIRQLVDADVAAGRHGGRVVTRFPPEPNGYLHIGHAKSSCLNFGVAREHGGRCHLRFDDTNPNTEDVEYVDAIQADVGWLGFDWGAHRYFASDYFERLHGNAVELVRRGRAYVCDLSSEEIA